MRFGEASFVYDGTIDAYNLTMNINWKNKDQKAFIDYIKLIPASDRAYNNVTRVWTIDPKHYQFVAIPLQTFFHPVFLYTKEQYEEQQREWAHAANPPIPVDQYKMAFISILRSVNILDGSMGIPDDFAAANKLYRKACMYLHPDRNSDPGAAESMSKLNEAWAVIKKENYKQGA